MKMGKNLQDTDNKLHNFPLKRSEISKQSRILRSRMNNKLLKRRMENAG